MNRELKGSQFRTKQSSPKQGTELSTPENGEILPPKRRHLKVDDKAATLEVALARAQKKSENEKFIGSFATTLIFLSFISVYVPWYAFMPLLILAVIMLIALAYHWNFPQIVKPLNDLAYLLMRRLGSEKQPPSPDEE
jgi:hypothetical protein